ncbi:MAG: hypothetical protein WC867_08095 [Candidatus Pacearchaeota archaeon]|jgi:hypothetical protein
MDKKHIIVIGISILILLSLGAYIIIGQEKSPIEKFREMDKSDLLKKYDTNNDGFLDHAEKIPAHKDLGIDTENCPYEQPDSIEQCPFKEKGLNNPAGHE